MEELRQALAEALEGVEADERSLTINVTVNVEYVDITLLRPPDPPEDQVD